MIKLIKIFSIALVINSLLLFVVHAEELQSLLNSAVNFSLTISSSGEPSTELLSSPQSKPKNIAPADNTETALPIVFAMSPFQQEGGQYGKTELTFWRQGGSPDQPILRLETVLSPEQFGNFPFNHEIFQGNINYLWRIRYMNNANVWSEFSDPTDFTIRLPQIAYSGGSSGGGGSPSVFQTSPVVSPPAPKKSTTSKPSMKKTAAKPKEAPIKMKLSKKKIPQGKSLDVRIKQQRSRPSKATQFDVQIRKKKVQKDGKQDDTVLLKRKEAFRPAKKRISGIEKLGIGTYTAFLTYEDEGTIFAFSEDFEIVPLPRQKQILAAVLLWNEVGLSFLLLMSSIFLVFSKRRTGS